MKLHFLRRDAGNTLVVVLLLTSLMGFVLGSYLVLVEQQNGSIMRSVSWNSCIPVSEAGIEEAMSHLNRNGIGNLLSSGWDLVDGVYTKTRYLGDSYFVASISQTDPPVIVSEGYVPAQSGGAGPLAWVAAIGYGTPPEQYTSRKIRVLTLRDGVWGGAMVAKGTIDLKGNGITSDSFDSTDPAHSNNGMYDENKRKDKGDIATNLGIIDSISVGNADIYGHASTGPGGTIAIGPNGGVGSLTWHLTHTGIEPGWTTDDMNVYFPPVEKKFSSGFTVKSGTLGSTTFHYLLDGGATGADYVMSSLSLSSKDVMLITNKVRLLVTGNISLKGTIQIAAGSSLELYMEGASADIGGNGIANNTGLAINFCYYGLPTNTSITFSGNGEFVGAIYAPNADFTLSGGGNSEQDFVGSSVTKTVGMNGHFNFHYDEALAKSGLARGYVINSWSEL